MKRILALIFAISLLLVGCKKTAEAPAETVATTAPTTVATTPDTEPATEPAADPEPVVPAVIRHPLNGQVLEQPFTGRVTAVVLSNEADAMPQHGLGEADVIFEAEVEGGITRLLAVFSDISSTKGKIGPIRSARSFFNNITLSFDGTIIHCGGSRWGINGYMDDSNVIENWKHINQQYNGSYFYRDPSRSAYWDWLNLFTTGDELQRGLTDLGYTTDEVMDFGWQFDENAALDGETANKVVVNFRGSKTTTMTYNEETGCYFAEQHRRDHIDGNDNKVLSYTNVICLYTEQSGIYDGEYTRSFYDLVGEGTGHLAIGGKIVPIRWNRAVATDPFSFTLSDGTPVTLGVGTTYVGIASDTVSVSYE